MKIVNRGMLLIYIAFMISVSLSSFSFSKTVPQVKEQSNGYDFSKQPVKYLTAIYMDYHNGKVDSGIKKAKEALLYVNELYKKSPNTIIKGKGLKLNKAYQIKSTLHTLLGMLYYKKAMIGDDSDKDIRLAPVYEKLKKGEGLTDKDLELVSKVMAEESKNEQLYINMAIREFKEAIKIDPKNPSAHFQLGLLYSGIYTGESNDTAERHIYLSAKLSYEEGDMQAVSRAFDILKGLNPNSLYLKQIKRFMKEAKGE